MVLFRNNFLISRSVPFGRNYSLRCLLMPLHVSSIHATDGFEIRHFRAFPQGKNLLFFLTEMRLVCSCRMHNDLQCPMLPSLLTIDVLSNTARESVIEQVLIYTSWRENWKEKKENGKKQNYSKIVIVLRSIHRVEKYTHLKREKPLKRLNTFL